MLCTADLMASMPLSDRESDTRAVNWDTSLMRKVSRKSQFTGSTMSMRSCKDWSYIGVARMKG